MRISASASSGRLIWREMLDAPSSILVGKHAIYWNGKQAGGRSLAAGIYILKVSLISNSGANNGYFTIIMLR